MAKDRTLAKPDYAEGLRFQLTYYNAPRTLVQPVKEHKFHETRNWAFDLAWPDALIAVEIEGGIWRKGGGAHTGKGAIRDIEKYNEATMRGWRIIRVTPDHVKDGRAVAIVTQALQVLGRDLIRP